jgi:DNA-directed RNA polymerase specialized sigma24 family protein
VLEEKTMKSKTSALLKSAGEYPSFPEALTEFLARRESVSVVLTNAEFQARLKLICRGLEGEPEKAAELFQDTCLRLLKYEKRILQKKPANAEQFFSLVFKVAQNLRLDSRKKLKLLFRETPIDDLVLQERHIAANVGQLSTDELREIIGSVVEQKLTEILGDPDEGLEIRADVRGRLLRQKKAVAKGERGETLDEVEKRLGVA